MQLKKSDIKTIYQCECGKISYWYEPRCVRCDSDKITTIKVIDVQKLQQVIEFYDRYNGEWGFLCVEKLKVYKDFVKKYCDKKRISSKEMSKNFFIYCFEAGLK